MLSECSTPPAPLALHLFGPFGASVRGEPLPRLRSRKGQWLLALLALRDGREVERSWLMELLWPDVAMPQGAMSLRTSLRDLRQALGPEAGRLYTPTSRGLALDLTGAMIDALAFDQAVARGDEASLRYAAGLYRGPLLEGCAEEWCLPERQAREQRLLAALETLAARAMERQDAAAAADYLRRAVAVDPLRENTQRALMQSLAAGGSFAAARLAYRELRLHLHRELHTEPDPETQALFHQLRSQARRAAGGSTTVLIPARPAEEGEPHLPCSGQHVLPRPAGHGHTAGREPAGGAVPLDSPLYIARPTDEAFAAAIDRGDSLVLVKGPRQVGKTSLLARGLQQARHAGARVVLTDVDVLNADHLVSAEAFLLALAHSIADQLDLDVFPIAGWNAQRGANPNFERYLRREVLGTIDTPLVWGLNDVDRLFGCDFGSEIFALFCSWHNERALDPAGPWTRLSLVMTYATEAHLFITDLNNSPFNVGTRLTLEDFTREDVAELNQRYGSPLPDAAALARYYELVGGHPYLVRRGLDEMAVNGTGMAEFEARADSDRWIFGDHLQRMRSALARDPDLCEVVRGVVAGRHRPKSSSFYRLRSAGILAGESEVDARPRCRLYAHYLARCLS